VAPDRAGRSDYFTKTFWFASLTNQSYLISVDLLRA